MRTFTIKEIHNYLKSQDSLGDIHYNLNEENIDKANLFVGKEQSIVISDIKYNIRYQVARQGDKYVDKNNMSINIAGLWDADELLWIIVD